jgi:hypothetical protein
MRKYDTIAMLMLAAVLSAWLGVWGPTNTTALKNWQPLMADEVGTRASSPNRSKHDMLEAL